MPGVVGVYIYPVLGSDLSASLRAGRWSEETHNISVNNATMNAANPPRKRQSREVLGLVKLTCKDNEDKGIDDDLGPMAVC